MGFDWTPSSIWIDVSCANGFAMIHIVVIADADPLLVDESAATSRKGTVVRSGRVLVSRVSPGVIALSLIPANRL